MRSKTPFLVPIIAMLIMKVQAESLIAEIGIAIAKEIVKDFWMYITDVICDTLPIILWGPIIVMTIIVCILLCLNIFKTFHHILAYIAGSLSLITVFLLTRILEYIYQAIVDHLQGIISSVIGTSVDYISVLFGIILLLITYCIMKWKYSGRFSKGKKGNKNKKERKKVIDIQMEKIKENKDIDVYQIILEEISVEKNQIEKNNILEEDRARSKSEEDNNNTIMVKTNAKSMISQDEMNINREIADVIVEMANERKISDLELAMNNLEYKYFDYKKQIVEIKCKLSNYDRKCI